MKTFLAMGTGAAGAWFLPAHSWKPMSTVVLVGLGLVIVVVLARHAAQVVSELRRLRGMAKESRRFAALTTLAAGVAHEMRSPLGTIFIAAHELQRLALQRGDDEMKADAELIRAETERCRKLLERLNARSAEELAELPTECDVSDVIAAVRASLSPIHLENLQAFAQIEGSLCIPVAPVADAVASLVRNACEASRERVQLEATFDERDVVFCVTDSGGPVPHDVLARAGDPFYTTKHPGSGMGLGLYLVRLLAERLGGGFSLSNDGCNTIAALRLPRRVQVDPGH